MQILINSFKAVSLKNLAIGPLPIILSPFFSKIIYAIPLAPSPIAQLLRLSKKLLGFECVLGTGIAFTIPPLLIVSLNIFNETFSDLNKSVTFLSFIGFLKSGLSVPYLSMASL